MQNDFITGPLGTPEARAIVPAVAEKIKAYHEAGDPVLFTLDTHYDNYLKTQEGKKLPVPHCIHNTPGAQLHPDINALFSSGDAFVKKQTFSASNIDFLWAIRFPDEVEVCGVCTDICVISNIVTLKTLYPDVPITVDPRCVAGTTPEANQAALTVLRSLQIDILPYPTEKEG